MKAYREIDYIKAKKFMERLYNEPKKLYGDIVRNFQIICRFELENDMLESSRINYGKFFDEMFSKYVSQFKAETLFLEDWELERILELIASNNFKKFKELITLLDRAEGMPYIKSFIRIIRNILDDVDPDEKLLKKYSLLRGERRNFIDYLPAFTGIVKCNEELLDTGLYKIHIGYNKELKKTEGFASEEYSYVMTAFFIYGREIGVIEKIKFETDLIPKYLLGKWGV